jgi:hypothetical protein
LARCHLSTAARQKTSISSVLTLCSYCTENTESLILLFSYFYNEGNNVYCSKILIEKHIDFNVETYAAFIDLEKAFGKVNCI